MLITIKRRSEIVPKEQFSDLPPILQRIYAQRGITTEEDVNHSLAKALAPSELLNVMDGVELIHKCLKNDQCILVIGDFDADGATSTALFIRALHAFGYENVQYLVPNRFEFGYGLTPEIVEVAEEEFNPDLIVTVDNGISSLEGVALAKAKGIYVLITDHHLPGDSLPQADVIINPNQPNDRFPSKNLAGVGVVFYVLLALRTYLREQGWFDEKKIPEPKLAQFLDLVAVGTVADVAKLDYNNRILVDQGLKRIRASKCCPGIRAILNVAGKKLNKIGASDLGFVIGPRLNAAGRLQDMALGIECLLANNEDTALSFASKLNQLNEDRKAIEQKMQGQALNILNSADESGKLTSNNFNKFGITLFNSKWHQGVSGIVAARIKEKFHRPTIVFAKVNEGELKGSARSITGLHIRDALELIATRNPKLITTFGGHAMAAGLSILISNYDEFSRIFNDTIEELVTPEQLEAILLSDGELDESELSLDVAEMIFRAGPWGQGFPEPVFDGIFNIHQHRLVGERHLKLILIPSTGMRKIDAIAFNIDKYNWDESVTRIQIAYQLSVNEFRGARTPQLVVQYLEPFIS